jgi:hypothetical protein
MPAAMPGMANGATTAKDNGVKGPCPFVIPFFSRDQTSVPLPEPSSAK